MDQNEKQQNFELAEKLMSEQNFGAAVIAGAVATLLSAVSYGIITTVWSFSYGFAAAGIGIAIGISMQYLGRGIRLKFAFLAAFYTIAGCIIGNLFRSVMYLAQVNSSSPIDVLQNNTLSDLVKSTVTYFALIDLVFWFVAVYFAVFLVKRPLSRSDRLAIGMYERTGG